MVPTPNHRQSVFNLQNCDVFTALSRSHTSTYKSINDYATSKQSKIQSTIHS